MDKFWETIKAFFTSSGIAGFFQDKGYLNLIMIVIALVLLYLAIRKKFEPYLLLPIAFGMLLVNLPFVAKEIFAKGTVKAIRWLVKQKPGFYTMNDFTRDMVIPMVKSLYKDFFSRV